MITGRPAWSAGTKPRILTGMLEATVREPQAGPRRSSLCTGSYPKVRRRQDLPGFTFSPARPHSSTNSHHAAAVAPHPRDRHRGHFHAPTIPRMCWLV